MLKLKILIILAILSLASAVGVTISGEVFSGDKEYLVRFFQDTDETTILYSEYVTSGEEASYKGKTPTKEAMLDTYRYVFIGWDQDLTSVDRDIDTHAVFRYVELDNHIIFKNDDGTTIYETYVADGETPYFPLTNIISSFGISYEFVGWDRELAPAYYSDTYYAKYRKNTNMYNVYFVDDDGTILDECQVFYGESAVYAGKDLSSKEVDDCVYIFKGWDKPLSRITKDTVFYAQYDQKYPLVHATFLNYDGQELYSAVYEKGGFVEYNGPVPVRKSENDIIYDFAGWDKELGRIYEDTLYTAMFSDITNQKFTVTFKQLNGDVIYKTEVYAGYSTYFDYSQGQIDYPEPEEGYYYSFTGNWDRRLYDINASFDTYPVFEKYADQFNVSYFNYDGELLATAKVPFGQNGYDYYPGNEPIREEDEYYTYTFDKFDHEYELNYVRDDLEVSALFDATPKTPISDPESENPGGEGGEGDGSGGSGGSGAGSGAGGGGGGISEIASVSFCNYNGKELYIDLLLDGKDAVYIGDTPHRPNAGEVERYYFSSWDKSLENVRWPGFKTYAQYIAYIDGQYFDMITIRNDDGSLIAEYFFTQYDDRSYPDGYTLQEILDMHEPEMVSAYYEELPFKEWETTERNYYSCQTIYPIYGEGGGSGSNVDVSSSIGGAGGTGESDTTPLFTFTTDYQGTVYIRYSSYQNLNGNDWIIENELEDSVMLWELGGALGRSGISPQCTITLRGAEHSKYTLIPQYFSGFTIGQLAQFSDNHLVNTTDSSEVPTTFYFNPYMVSENTDYTALLNNVDSNSVDFEYYNQFARDNYLEVPGAEYNYLQKFISDHNLNQMTIFEVRDFIKNYATYNLNYAPYPDNESYVIYFLEEAKEGVCNHYASALTLIYRMLGYPARFVTGYMSNSNGGETTVTAMDAHAWTEIYIDNLGWVYVDGTGAIGGGQGGGAGGSGLDVDSSIGGGGSSEQDETPLFTYETNYQGPVYIRYSSYQNLENNKWTIKYDKVSYDYAYFVSNAMNSSGIYSSYEITLSGVEDSQYVLLPQYYFDYKYGSISPITIDNYGAADKENVPTSFTFYPYLINSEGELNALKLYASSINYDSYNYIAKACYTGVSEKEALYLEEFIADNHLDEMTIFEVRDFIKNYATYNLNYAPYPDNESYVIYFLEEAKEGVCNHYASALTLIYRMLGYPARFVTGYMSNSNGGETTVTAMDAHAWTEIYINNLGWVYVDGTGAMSGGQGGSGGGQGGSGGGQGGSIPIDKENMTMLYIGNDKYVLTKNSQGIYESKDITITGTERVSIFTGKQEYTPDIIINDENRLKYSGDLPYLLQGKYSFKFNPNSFILEIKIVDFSQYLDDTSNIFGEYQGGNKVDIYLYPEEGFKPYDGTRMKLSFGYSGSLDTGDNLYVLFIPGEKNVGFYTPKAYVRVYDQDNNDVSYKYYGHIVLHYTSYIIVPADITIETGSAAKVDDGTPLTCDKITVSNGSNINVYLEITGIQNNIGSSQNLIDMDSIMFISKEDGHIETDNYNIEVIYGDLVVE